MSIDAVPEIGHREVIGQVLEVEVQWLQATGTMRCLKTGPSQRVLQMRRETEQRKRQTIQKQVQTQSGGRCKTARRKRLHDGVHEGHRERTVRRALGVPTASARLHQTFRCPLTTRHTANAAVAAGEQECRALLKELRRERAPEAKAEYAKHARIRTQVANRMAT